MKSPTENVMGNVRIVAKHSAIYSTAEILKKGIGFVMIPLYTHYLTPADYGVIEVLNLILEVLGMLVGAHIASAQTRFYHQYHAYEEKREVFTTALLGVSTSSILSVLLLWTASGWLARTTLGSEAFTPHCRVVILCLGIQSIFLVAENDLIVRKKSLFYSILVIFLMVLSLSLNILFLSVFHLGVWAILWSILITKAVNLAVVPMCLHGNRIRFSWHKFVPMVRFALPLLPASLAMFFLHFGDRFFLQRFCSLSDVGIYSLGYKFGMIISILITSPFQRVWGTHSFEIEKQPNAKLVYARVFTYLALLLAFTALAIGIFIKDVIGVIAPPDYAAAASIVPIVLLGYAFLGLNNSAALGIMIRNKTKYIAFIQIPVVALNAILNLLLIPAYNIRGAALATMISFGIMFFITLRVSQNLYPIAYEYRRLAMVSGTTIALFILAKLVSGPWHLLLLYHGLLLLALPLSLYVLKFFTREEMDELRVYIGKLGLTFRKSAA